MRAIRLLVVAAAVAAVPLAACGGSDTSSQSPRGSSRSNSGKNSQIASNESSPQRNARGGAEADARPNVVLIVADDLGWNDVSYHGSSTRTPRIDRLVDEGIELDRFYVAPMCSPTRAGLMTGRNPIRFGMARAVVAPWRRYGLPPGETTLAEALASGGYEYRGAFGKWHLGHLEAKWHPLAQGFTHFHGCYNGAIDYFTHERDGEMDWHVDYTPTDEPGYATDLIADAACAFIETHGGGAPFLCYVPFTAPHLPLEAPEDELARHPDLSGNPRIMAAMITRLDSAVGRILDAIDRAGIARNTIVWLLSDNGGTTGFFGNNAPLRGHKLDVFEGGIRTPACVRWPARLEAGRRVTAPTAYIDVLPTLLAAAGIERAPGKPLDGVDLMPELTGTAALPERDLYFYCGQDGPVRERVAVISGPWKLVVIGPEITGGVDERHRRMLFAIEDDPNEEHDVLNEHPEIVETLTNKLVAYRSLQPTDAIAPMLEGRDGFRPPPDWEVQRPR